MPTAAAGTVGRGPGLRGDTDDNDTPAPLIFDIVEFAKSAASDLRRDYDEALES
jgi:hypothetical protein